MLHAHCFIPKQLTGSACARQPYTLQREPCAAQCVFHRALCSSPPTPPQKQILACAEHKAPHTYRICQVSAAALGTMHPMHGRVCMLAQDSKAWDNRQASNLVTKGRCALCTYINRGQGGSSTASNPITIHPSGGGRPRLHQRHDHDGVGSAAAEKQKKNPHQIHTYADHPRLSWWPDST